MKNIIIIMLVLVVLVVGFYLGKGYFVKEEFAMQINNFTMTKEEFEDYFQEMNVGREDNVDVREGVLEALVSKKLVLQEAEKVGLHKSKEFLNSLQHYYEQLLFKLIIDLKSKELASRVKVSEQEINDKYNQMIAEGLSDKPLTETYSQIQWQILRKKQAQVLNDWLQEVREESVINIDQELLLNK
ncbi:MAG: SurA N-terminal domain-containing protein [Candidatus Saelkia tenebricola]|nr:SurA N-terminal domain-containing protein [Candidatus Saelkia tenebricola]